MARKEVLIIMGSKSDLRVMADAADQLQQFGVACDVEIVSAHRTPKRLVSVATSAAKQGYKVVIAGAGGSAHLPGMTAAFTHLPVIGVPVITRTMKGLDSLLSIAQMPPGIPVATVAVNGAKNAGLLAAQILAVSDARVRKRVAAFRGHQERTVLAEARRLKKLGYKRFMGNHG